MVDHCQRNLLDTEELNDFPGNNRYLLELTLLVNTENKTVVMVSTHSIGSVYNTIFEIFYLHIYSVALYLAAHLSPLFTQRSPILVILYCS